MYFGHTKEVKAAYYLQPSSIKKISVYGKKLSYYKHFDAEPSVKNFWGKIVKSEVKEGWGTHKYNTIPLDVLSNSADVILENGTLFVRPYIIVTDDNDNHSTFYFDNDEEALEHVKKYISDNNLSLSLIHSTL